VSPSPWTLPSLGSLLTGTYPGEHRLLEDLSTVAGDVPALAEACRAQGLRTAAIVSNPWLATGALARGFDSFEVAERLECLWPIRGTRLYAFLSKAMLRAGALDSAERLSTDASSWITGGRGAWFLWLHYFDPHLPNWPGAPWDRLYGPAPVRVGSSVTVEEIRDGDVADEPGERDEIARLYAGEVARTDHGIGRVLRAVRGDPAGTAIVFTADHGEELWDHDGYGHGHTMFDEVVRVPLFVSLPDRPGGGVTDRLVRLVDVAPTALAAAGLDAPAGPAFTGRSLLSDAAVPTTYGEATLYGPEQKYLRTDRWQLVYRPESDEDDAFSLFDLVEDPGEQHDLAATRPALRDSLFTLLELWMERVGSEGAMAARDVPDNLDPSVREQLRALGYIP
jgi:choline-sulfatase